MHLQLRVHFIFDIHHSFNFLTILGSQSYTNYLSKHSSYKATLRLRTCIVHATDKFLPRDSGNLLSAPPPLHFIADYGYLYSPGLLYHDGFSDQDKCSVCCEPHEFGGAGSNCGEETISPASCVRHDETRHLQVDANKLALHAELHRIALYELLVRTASVRREGRAGLVTRI